jgi:hypothetical protein
MSGGDCLTRLSMLTHELPSFIFGSSFVKVRYL